MNKAFFTDIKIENFKSLRSVELKDCNRINVLIGKPNVGKSNILETLSLFSVPESKNILGPDLLKTLIRVDSETEMFFDGEDGFDIKLTSNLYNIGINYGFGKGLSLVTIPSPIDPKLKNKVKKYVFKTSSIQLKAQDDSNGILDIPFGKNLLNVLQTNSTLLKACRELFKEYHLQFLFDKVTRSLRIVKQIKNEADEIPAIFSMPYGSVADTLQRIIFYKTAIASNTDSVLLFEEPEAHSFPPYIVHITQEIINATSNQFFITTHSPFVLDDLMQNARKELAVFVVHWKNGETITTKLTDVQLEEVYQYGVGLFTNIENYF